jgi:thiol-disulfide isomerase/thioredoxin
VRKELSKRFTELDRDQNDSLSELELGSRLFRFLNANQDKEVLLEEVFSVVQDKGIEALKAVAENQTAPEVDETLEPIRQGAKRLVPGDHQVGRMIPDLAMTNVAGKSFKLSDFQDAKAIVIALTNTTCPICKKYAPTLAKVEADYRDHGVVFVYVNPTVTDKQSTIDKVIAEHGMKGHYVRDNQGTISQPPSVRHIRPMLLFSQMIALCSTEAPLMTNTVSAIR